MSKAEGVVVVDDPANLRYPMPLDCAGRNETFVGRIREDISSDNGLSFFVVSDNLRKGAAWNAVQIAQEWIDGHDIPEPVLNRVEAGIRAFDPCLSCSTHAIGKMPMEVSLLDHEGAELDGVRRG
jgi:hypothetical protein